MLGMMADNIEHVISYDFAFDKFNSTGARRLRRDLALGPVPARLGRRRWTQRSLRLIIQCGMAVFIVNSVGCTHV